MKNVFNYFFSASLISTKTQLFTRHSHSQNKNTQILSNKLYFKGLRILAFPCNQFAGQEPGDAEQIQCFLKDNKVNFDLFEKINVNGNSAHPLWAFLKNKQGGTLIDAIKWNFTKFIVDKKGVPVERHGPSTSPQQMKKNLEKYFDDATKQEL